MTSKQRHVYGDPKVRPMPVLAASVIDIGDMCWFDASNNVVKRASDYTWDTNLATTQGTFKDVYCGVARSAKRSTDPAGTIQLDTSGVFRMDCASAAFDLGVFLGPADSGSSTLENQKLVAVANATLAVGKPAVQYSSAVTEIYASLESTIHSPAGGVQTVT